MSTEDRVRTAFVERFGEQPTYIIRAPGRINIIGDHTDYNGGFVMPVALNRGIWMAIRAIPNASVQIHSLNFDEQFKFDIGDYDRQSISSPVEYMKGMAWALDQAGYRLSGFEGVMQGDIPMGAGLSSSAALEVAIAKAFHATSSFAWSPVEIAQLAQKAENQWVGVNSGIMDQMISAAGKQGYALFIDCDSLELEWVPIQEQTAIVILDTGTRRKLISSAYNQRRQQCIAAAAYFDVSKLREVSIDEFTARCDGLDEITLKRARHVITENERVKQAKHAMIVGEMDELGRILNASHTSLRDDYEVSSDALNAIVEASQEHPACYGARMTGGGFAGCAVALVDASQFGDFAAFVENVYVKNTSNTPKIYVTHAANGAEVINPLITE